MNFYKLVNGEFENTEIDMEQLLELRAELELKKKEIELKSKKKSDIKANWEDNTELISGISGLVVVIGMATSFGYITIPVAMIMKVVGVSMLGGVASALAFDILKDLAPQKQVSYSKQTTLNKKFVPTFAIKKEVK